MILYSGFPNVIAKGLMAATNQNKTEIEYSIQEQRLCASQREVKTLITADLLFGVIDYI